MTPAQAWGLLRRWRAGDTRRDEIDEALVELADALDRLERGRAKVAELVAPVRDLRAAAERGGDWLARNDRDRSGTVTPP
jgi:hypothetical protein